MWTITQKHAYTYVITHLLVHIWPIVLFIELRQNLVSTQMSCIMSCSNEVNLLLFTLNHQPGTLLHFASNVHQMATIQSEIFRPLSKSMLRWLIESVRVHSCPQVLSDSCVRMTLISAGSHYT